jgi:phosphoesterase RecJ-like protein
MVSAAIRQPTEAGVYRVSMRSSCEVDVSAVCASFGGGGHVRAAGCTITCDDGMDAVVNMVAEALEGALRGVE